MAVSVETVVNAVEVMAPATVNIVEVSYLGIQGGQGIQGEPGFGVTENSLTVGNYSIRWNSELDTLDIFYQEV